MALWRPSQFGGAIGAMSPRAGEKRASLPDSCEQGPLLLYRKCLLACARPGNPTRELGECRNGHAITRLKADGTRQQILRYGPELGPCVLTLDNAEPFPQRAQCIRHARKPRLGAAGAAGGPLLNPTPEPDQTRQCRVARLVRLVDHRRPCTPCATRGTGQRHTRAIRIVGSRLNASGSRASSDKYHETEAE